MVFSGKMGLLKKKKKHGVKPRFPHQMATVGLPDRYIRMELSPIVLLTGGDFGRYPYTVYIYIYMRLSASVCTQQKFVYICIYIYHNIYII